MSIGLSYYLLTVVSSLNSLIAIIASLTLSTSLIFVFCITISISCEYNNELKNAKYTTLWKQMKKVIWALVIMCSILVFTPDKKDMLIIAGLSQAEDSQPLKEIGGTAKKALDLINKKLDEQLGETK